MRRHLAPHRTGAWGRARRGLSELFNVNYFIVSQTNPHIVPILRLKRWVCKQSATLATLATFVESEWKHRCRQVRDLAPALDVLGICSLFGQQWEGDVTVVMPFTYKQLSKVVTNPSRDDLLYTALQGEREMWPRLATVETNCGIEVQLDESSHELRVRMHQRTNSAAITRRARVVRSAPRQPPPPPSFRPRLLPPGSFHPGPH